VTLLGKVRPLPRAPTAVEDSVLLDRVAQGDLGALGLLYDRHGAALLGFASRLTSRSDAEDVVQTVFLRVVRRAASFDGRTPSARAWLFAMTDRVASEHRRSVRRFTSALVDVALSRAPARPPSLGERRDLERALSRLSTVKRATLLLAEVEGFTCDEIALMLRVPVGTVWTRLHHARRELRRELEGSEP
jgi:RNA polymerase sigma-70 factor (ECF subfamily)